MIIEHNGNVIIIHKSNTKLDFMDISGLDSVERVKIGVLTIQFFYLGNYRDSRPIGKSKDSITLGDCQALLEELDRKIMMSSLPTITNR